MIHVKFYTTVDVSRGCTGPLKMALNPRACSTLRHMTVYEVPDDDELTVPL